MKVKKLMIKHYSGNNITIEHEHEKEPHELIEALKKIRNGESVYEKVVHKAGNYEIQRIKKN